MSSPSALYELRIVQRAIAALPGVTHDSLAAHLGCARSTVSCYLTGQRRPPAGLVFALLSHLDEDGRALVLRWIAEDYDAGSVVSISERQALDTVIDAVERFQATAQPVDPSGSPARRAA